MKLSRIPLALLLVALSQGAFGQEESPPWPVLQPSKKSEPLANTAPLTMKGDIASEMVAGIDQFLLRQIDESVAKREQHWKRDVSSPEAYSKSIEPNRQRLREMLGMVDEIKSGPLMSDETVDETYPPLPKTGIRYRYVRWPVLEGVTGGGILLLPPEGTEVVADVISIQDAANRPQHVLTTLTMVSGVELSNDYSKRLAYSGCRVLVPMLIDREEHRYKMPNREWAHRPAYELGRTLAGYETQKIIAAIDALSIGQDEEQRPIGVIGFGEGGRLALYAGALDDRIDASCVGGYFNPRQQVWNETADRTVFGLLREFGDAEIASMIAPRSLSIQIGSSPSFVFRPDKDGKPEVLEARASKSGKPGALFSPVHNDESKAEFDRLLSLLKGLDAKTQPQLFELEGRAPFSFRCQAHFAKALSVTTRDDYPDTAELPAINRDDAPLHAEQLAEIERFNQRVLQNAYQERIEYMKDLKTDSLEAFNGSVEAYREKFSRDVVGEFDVEKLPLNPRSRPFQEGPLTVSYEVALDVFPDVIAYGVLTLPKDLKLDGSEKRPVVVCQHGLEGRPQDVVSEAKFKSYAAFATRLAERGFITFAPQNPYIFHDRFRTLQFKSAAVGCTLFSTIVPQHQQITDWLQTQPYVDGDRIGFYGLSYGGKSAMRIPPLVSDYALSICSADFNEWVWKNASTDQRSLRYSYSNKGEYEIFEFGLGRTFNYAEMAFLICPRPFMVERGHFDGVGPDDRVAQEFAKIRFLYQAKLGIGERTEIEWFAGPHTINGVGSYDFLHRHLDWPVPQEQ